MRSFTAVTSLLAAAASTVLAAPSVSEQLAPRASTLPSITVKGNAFWNGNTRFYMKGVDYQPGGSSKLADPLADTATCKRDIPYFKKLGANTIRIYTVDNTANHDECMQALSDAGIYLVLDVNSPKYSLRRDKPAQSYNSIYLQNIFATIDKFAKYPNTLAFLSGNEVINDDSTTSCAPYVKAVTRDMRTYLASRNYRQIPVGYSAADVDSNRMEMAHYMNCGSDSERSDFFCFNDYSWCDPSSFQISGWDQKVKNFTGYGLPIFLSEYGCIDPGPRKWDETKTLFSSSMSSVYSGGLAYEYSEEGNKYGLGTISGSTYTPGSQFTALMNAFNGLTLPSGDGGYSMTGGASTCPSQSPTWNVTTGSALPPIPALAAAMMKNGAGAGVGLLGLGSQEAGGAPGSLSSGTPVSGGALPTGSGASGTSAAMPGMIRPFETQALFVSVIAIMFTLFGATML